jgi:type IV secretory pathway TrbF-like protein
MITHETFGTPQGRQDPGVVGWLAVTVVVVLVGVMLWLMASRRLLAYIIEVEDSDDSSKS